MYEANKFEPSAVTSVSVVLLPCVTAGHLALINTGLYRTTPQFLSSITSETQALVEGTMWASVCVCVCVTTGSSNVYN